MSIEETTGTNIRNQNEACFYANELASRRNLFRYYLNILNKLTLINKKVAVLLIMRFNTAARINLDE